MSIIDHRSLVSLVNEGIVYEQVSGIVWAYLRETDLDLDNINYVLSKFDHDYFACFGFEFPGGMHACVSFIQGGTPASQFTTATPGMTKLQALGEALRLVDEYQKGNN